MDSVGITTETSFIFFASRGLGKSWLTMVFCLAKSILYPGIKIVVASSVKEQALKFIKKVYEVNNNRPNVDLEIQSVKLSKESGVITLRNTSTITAVICSDNGRGDRANISILDESNQMDELTIKKAILPFMTLTNRGQTWAMNPIYRNEVLNEHNSKIFLTSVDYKEQWSYKNFEQYLEYVANGRKDYFAVAIPYQFGIEANIINRSRIEAEVRESEGDISVIRSEYEVIPHGQSESPIFRYDQVSNSRKLIIPLIPPTDTQYISCRGDLRKLDIYQAKECNEVRLISMDVAVAGGRTNDNTVFTIFRLTN